MRKPLSVEERLDQLEATGAIARRWRRTTSHTLSRMQKRAPDRVAPQPYGAAGCTTGSPAAEGGMTAAETLEYDDGGALELFDRWFPPEAPLFAPDPTDPTITRQPL